MLTRNCLITILLITFVVQLPVAVSQGTQTRTERTLPEEISNLKFLNALDFDSVGLDTFITDYMDAHHIPGLSGAIVKNGEMIWTGSYGNAYFQPEVLVSYSTLFMLASITKTVTSTALMQLYDQNLFDLYDPVNDYLPFDVVNPFHPDIEITFFMLLTHTSSIRDNWYVMPYYSGDPTIQLGTYLYNYLVPGGSSYYAYLNYAQHQPGTQYDYSNNGIALVGYLVEQISGASLEDYCQENLFTPLDMYEASYFLANLDTMHVAMPFNWSGSSYNPVGHFGYADWPSGQLRTSSVQLLHFLTSYLQGGIYVGNSILNSATVDMMLSSQIPSIDPTQGLVWYQINLDGRQLWGHGGGDEGVSTEMYCCTEENSGVVLLTNGNAYAYEVLDALFDYAAGYGISASVTMTPDNPPVQIPASGGDFSFDIEIENIDSTEIFFDIWIEIELPSGAVYGPVIMRQDLVMPTGAIIQRENLVQSIPPSAPPGQYNYIAKIGEYSGYVVAADSFFFEKLPGNDFPNSSHGWILSGWEDEEGAACVAPTGLVLSGVFPNPFNPSTVLSYQLQVESYTTLTVFDIQGREVAELVNGHHEIGVHEVTFDGSGLSSGIYIYRLAADDQTVTGKMVLMK